MFVIMLLYRNKAKPFLFISSVTQSSQHSETLNTDNDAIIVSDSHPAEDIAIVMDLDNTYYMYIVYYVSSINVHIHHFNLISFSNIFVFDCTRLFAPFTIFSVLYCSLFLTAMSLKLDKCNRNCIL